MSLDGGNYRLFQQRLDLFGGGGGKANKRNTEAPGGDQILPNTLVEQPGETLQ